MFIFGFICGALAGVFTMTTICCLVVAEKEAEVDYLHEQLSEQLAEAMEGSYEEYKRNI